MPPGEDVQPGHTERQPPNELAHDLNDLALETRERDMSLSKTIPAQVQVHPTIPNPLSPSTPLDSSNVSPHPLQSNIGDVGNATVFESLVNVEVSTPDPSKIPADASKEGNKHPQVTPQSSMVLPIQLEPSNPQTATTTPGSEAQSALENQAPQFPRPLPELDSTLDGPAPVVGSGTGDSMFFGQSTAQAAQRRRNFANTNALTDYEADMTSKDRAKQKEAVKRYLTERVKQDWTWEWPRPDPATSPEASPETSPTFDDRVYTGEEQWKERDEWISNASEGEDSVGMPTSVSSPDTPSTRNSPFQFESPDGVGDTVKRTQWQRKQRRKKRLGEEMAWNVGLQCFVARRDAWTGARKVTRSSLGVVPLTKAQRSSVSSGDGSSSTAIEKEEDDEWEDDIEIPIAPPILPPDNQMRASILPGAYNTIYDKVVVQSLQPSCPMNLKDVTRSCVQGWKRDGEWPPKPTLPEPKRRSRKMSVASLFGLNSHEKGEQLKQAENEKVSAVEKKPSAGSGIRKSIQKILNLGHLAHKEKDSNPANGNRKMSKASGDSPVAGP